MLANLIVVGVGTVSSSHLGRSVVSSRTQSICFPLVYPVALAYSSNVRVGCRGSSLVSSLCFTLVGLHSSHCYLYGRVVASLSCAGGWILGSGLVFNWLHSLSSGLLEPSKVPDSFS